MSLIPRNTIFALLMSIEQDFRSVCASVLANSSDVLAPEEFEDAKRRYISDKKEWPTGGTWHDVLDYLDLSQLVAVLNRHAELISQRLGLPKAKFEKIVSRLQSLNPIRNRVCHARLLEPDDFYMTHEIAKEFVAPSVGIPFVRLKEVRHELESNIGYPLTISIPEFWRSDAAVIDNNLPTPDFDDIGFVGRDRDRTNLTKLLLGNKDIITVTGEGGVGKTSLTLRCLYDIIESSRSFDLVYWTTLKTNTLTVAGIRSIAGAMTSDIQVLSAVAAKFGSQATDNNREDLFEQVREILGTFRILLAIDNTETIARDALRPLFIDIPRDSKIVLTSRIGIGEFETRYPLEPMTARDSIELMRRTAKLFNVYSLVEKHNPEVEILCRSLFNNPLAIRWFVQSYSEGRSIKSLLDRHRSLSEVLSFCFENLYDALSEDCRRLLKVLTAVGRPLSEVQLALLADKNDVEMVRSDLRYLFSSNLLRRSSDTLDPGESLLWAPSDFAREYILSRDKPSVHDKNRFEGKYRELIQARDIARDHAAANRFLIRTITVSSTDEATVVILLQGALALSTENQHDKALATVRTACNLLPEYYEVWRVSAQVKARANDILGADNDFEKAIELADGASEPLIVHYVHFLLKQEREQEAANILSVPASKPGACTQLIAVLAWVKVRLGLLKEAMDLYEDVYDDIRALSGKERRQFLTQFANGLRRSTENSMLRQRLDDAFHYAIRSLEVVIDACENVVIDRGLTIIGQKCVNEVLSVLARRNSIEDWRKAEPLIRRLTHYFPLPGQETKGLEMILRFAHQISALDSFKAIFLADGSEKIISTRGRIMSGIVSKVIEERGFGFILGDDKQKYYFHKSSLETSYSWSSFCQLDNVFVDFIVKSSDRPGDSPVATNIYIISSDSHNEQNDGPMN